MNNHIISALLITVAAVDLHAMDMSQLQPSAVTKESCELVLRMSKLSGDYAGSTEQQTFRALDAFFSEKKIKDYADAAKFGRENVQFDNPDEFNTLMGALFKVNTGDVYPEHPRKYQAVIFGTSGIDVFMERLALLSRLAKSHRIETDEVVALVGNHAHREDLKDLSYLSNLPFLFANDFDLTGFDKKQALDKIAPLMRQQKWTHRDGMEVAWKLVACDSDMAEFEKNFRYFSGNSDTLRTEQLIQQFISDGLAKPLTDDQPIAFVVNAQGAAKTKEMVKKYFEDSNKAVDVLIARPAAEEIEAKLFNDNPQQRAMTKLFHFYRILEAIAKKD